MDVHAMADELGWGREPGRYFPKAQDAQATMVVDELAERKATWLGAALCGIGSVFLGLLIVLAVLTAITTQVDSDTAATYRLGLLIGVAAAVWAVLLMGVWILPCQCPRPGMFLLQHVLEKKHSDRL